MPLPKRLLEDIIFRFRYLRLYFKNNRKVRTFLFYPQYPSKRSVLYKIFGLMDYNRTNNPVLKYDYVINWQHATFRKEIPFLEELDKKFIAVESRLGFPPKKRYQSIIGSHDANTVIVERQWDSLAAMEAKFDEAFGDPEYQALADEGTSIIESTQWEVYTPLP